jgi:hypothetical protein
MNLPPELIGKLGTSTPAGEHSAVPTSPVEPETAELPAVVTRDPYYRDRPAA